MRKTLGMSIGISLLAVALSAPVMAHEHQSHEKEALREMKSETSIDHKEKNKEKRKHHSQMSEKHHEHKKMMKKKEFSHKENMKKGKHEYKKDKYKKHEGKQHQKHEKSHGKHSEKHHGKVELIDINYVVTKNNKPLFDGYIALPSKTNEMKYNDYHMPIGAISYNQSFNPLASKNGKASDTLFIQYNKDKQVVEFNIIEDGKPLYQTGVDYKEGEHAVRHLGDHKLHVTFGDKK